MDGIIERQIQSVLLTTLFGSGKGSGAALVMFLLGVAGTVLCLAAGKRMKQYEYHE